MLVVLATPLAGVAAGRGALASAAAATDDAERTGPRRRQSRRTCFWQTIMNSTDPADFEAYLAQFPEGVFRVLAENRLAALGAAADRVQIVHHFTDFLDFTR